MIKLDHVSKTFGSNIYAVSDVSFTIEDGEFVFFVGTSGAGKSTLLSLIIRQMLPTKGTITFDDWDLATLPKKQIPLLRRKIGSIFQDYKLLFDRTVEENISLTLDVQGKKSQEIAKYVNEAIEIVGLKGKGKLFPKELAGGEVQRVAIARAIVANPTVLLADEPTADLDPKNAWAIVELLKKINEENKTTIIMATHNTEIVNQMKRRVITLEDGRVVSDEKQGTYKHVPTIENEDTPTEEPAHEEQKSEEKEKIHTEGFQKL